MEKARLQLLATVAIGITINVVLSLCLYLLGIPMYLDVIGTIGVAFLAGSVPALIVAIFSNLFCSIINSMAIYYTVISVVIAVVSAMYIRNKGYNKTLNIIKLVSFVKLRKVIPVSLKSSNNSS